jgi:hypothetical protein
MEEDAALKAKFAELFVKEARKKAIIFNDHRF